MAKYTCTACGAGPFNSPKEVQNHKSLDCPANAEVKKQMQETIDSLTAERDGLKAELDELRSEPKIDENVFITRIDELESLAEELRGTVTSLEAKVNEYEDKAPAEKASVEAIQRMATELGVGFLIVKNSRYLVIPARFLPTEAKYLGQRGWMGMKVQGNLEGGDLVVEKVEFIRR